jgi:miniconductance mechanosensitive channel
MIRIGDWVELPQYGADGSVIEISISAVKIQNWDKTISTIPPYALLTSSFKNWRGMTESGGRRIMRSILLDMNSVCFCDEEMLTRFARIKYIAEHIENKRLELQSYNHEKQLDNEDLVNQRRLTNIGIFRTYVIAYLKNHPKINQEMTFLVRQLEPLPHGIPIQIYVFCKEKAWANYEGIQADIFDHLLAIVPEFNLRVFQNPSGRDFATLTQLHQHSAGSSNNH